MDRKTIAIIGMGAFGRFMLPYLTPIFDVTVYDPYQNLNDMDGCFVATDVAQVAKANYILLAVPVKAMESVCRDLKPFIQDEQTIIELASVKMIPRRILIDVFGECEGVNLLGVHPLFGPQSGKNGIEGLNIAISNIQGDQFQNIYDFLETLKLNITVCSAEEHDQQMAYVQGLTHLLAKTFNKMDIPDIFLSTKTYELLDQMWKTIQNDSDDLFDLIQSQNPYITDIRKQFINLTQAIDEKYKKDV